MKICSLDRVYASKHRRAASIAAAIEAGDEVSASDDPFIDLQVDELLTLSGTATPEAIRRSAERERRSLAATGTGRWWLRSIAVGTLLAVAAIAGLTLAYLALSGI